MCEHVFVTVVAPPNTELDQVRAVEVALRDLVGSFDPDAVFVFDAPEVFASFAAMERLAASAMTLLARRVEAAATWRRAGFRSAAEQLACVTGTSIAAARTMLDTSKLVDELPATASVMRAGTLSSPKATVIAAAAAIAPEAEAELLESAYLPYAEVRETGLRARGKDRDAAHQRITEQRHARDYADGEGAWNLIVRGPVDVGAEFRRVHDPIVEEMFKAARAEGRREPRDAYAFDAFMELVHRAEGAGQVPAGTATKTPARFVGLIRADIEALRRGSVDGDEICEIAGLGPIPVRVAADLLGEATLKLVITKGVDVMNVTHLGRSVTAAQQVALWWCSPGCTVEGCTRHRWLENDHRRDWVETHHTRLDETDPLCSHHHDLKTYAGWALVSGKGKRPMVPPDDPRRPKCRPPPDR